MYLGCVQCFPVLVFRLLLMVGLLGVRFCVLANGGAMNWKNMILFKIMSTTKAGTNDYAATAIYL